MSRSRRIARCLLADQRGQDTVEYIGVLAVVAALIGVVLLVIGPLGPMIEHGAECLVAKVFQLGTCSAGPAYPVSASTKTVGYDGRVAIVDGGHSYTITLTKLSNGTSKITAIDTGKLGVSAQVGADAELGPLGGAGADASIGGGIYGGDSNTWTFPSWSAGQKAFNKIAGGSSLGLTAHDAVQGSVGSLPGVGPLATGLFDKITGASGAPDQGSLPHQNLSSSTAGGGLQGSGDAGAHVNFGPLQDAVEVSLDANAGLQRITYGPEKGDWQLVAGLDGTADGTLADWLFGSQADAAGNVKGDVEVTFSPSGKPEKLEVTASGDGVWDVAPPSYAAGQIPGEDGSSKEGGKPGEGGKEPLLSISASNSGGSGPGTMFTGEIDLSDDPQATQDVTSLLEGDPSRIGDLIDQMNSDGTETIQTYHIERSNSKVGGKVSVGVGVGANLSDGSSNATYDKPKTREKGGQWHTGS